MSKFLLGKKMNMTQSFDETGKVVPVTVVKAGPIKVLSIRKYGKKIAAQVGFGTKAKLSKPMQGALKDVGNVAHLKEFAVADESIAQGATLNVSQFQVGDFVDVQGVMKGRGFTGAVKRYGFKGAPASHGHDHPRAVGSIGQRFPQHTLKGRRMAGRMGGRSVTVKNLQVIEIDEARNLLAVKGAIPGAPGSLVRITESKNRKSRNT